MNTKNHKPNKGSFKAGQKDKRRNDKGQMKAEAVALGALLKQYLVEEAGKPCRDSWYSKHGTNAQALAARIWDEAIDGKFPFVQFLADRIMGKVKDEIALGHENLRFDYDTLSMTDLRQSMKNYKESQKLTAEVVHVNDQGEPLPAMQP